jgi:hypothetical protein
VSRDFGVVRLDGKPGDQKLLKRIAVILVRGPDGTSIREKDGAGGCYTMMRCG